MSTNKVYINFLIQVDFIINIINSIESIILELSMIFINYKTINNSYEQNKKLKKQIVK